MNPKRLTEAILKSMGKENDPIGVLIEAVIEKEFDEYHELLKDSMSFIESDLTTGQQKSELLEKINNKIVENQNND